MPFAPSEREAREAIALTLGSIANIDACIGTVLDALANSKLANDTIVAFTSDHGDLMGDHGAMLKGPMHFRGLSHVPFIWSDPRAEQPARRVRAMGSTLDIARTVLAATGCEAALGMQGENLLPALSGDSQLEGRSCLIENESAQLLFGRPGPFKLRSLVTPDWRLTYSNDAALCELYDLRADPHETRNLWHDADHLPQRSRLLQALLDTMVRHADEGMHAHSGG